MYTESKVLDEKCLSFSADDDIYLFIQAEKQVTTLSCYTGNLSTVNTLKEILEAWEI